MEPSNPNVANLPAESFCSSCGTPLHVSGLGLLCPACLLERLIYEGGTDTPIEATPFGDYELLEELGRGGVGVVYRAWHKKLERTVALKMLLGGPFASPELTERFSREVKMVARLRHPGIVGLYETGEVEGVRFFTMELVEGRTLAALVRDGPISVSRACAYVRKAALAVAHAHEQHVLHRDIKPSNILVDPFDEPRVADFGLARLWLDGAEATVNVGQMGSPPYMAPEQVSITREVVGPAADIYALGAVLYHLLTGRPPHQGSRIEEVLAHVRDAPVAALSLLNPSIPRDLETICMKCMEREPGRRYLSAQDLAADLKRFESGEPVRARPVGAWGQAWRWSRRNRTLAATLTALILALAAVATDVAVQAVHNRRERQRLELEAYVTGMQAGSYAANEGDYPLARSYLSALLPPPGGTDLRGVEWRLFWAATASQAERVLHPHGMAIEQLAFAPDGQHLATNSLDGVANLIDLVKGTDPKPADLSAGGGWALAFDPTNKTCYIGVRSADGASSTVLQESLATRKTLWSTPGWRASLSRDGSRMAVTLGQPFPWVPASGGVDIWDTANYEKRFHIEGNYRAAALSPDGMQVALVPNDNSIRLRSLAENRELAKLSTEGPQAAVSFSPDGSSVASCGQGEASLWRVADGSLVARLPHPWLRVWSVAFSPDGTRLATTCSDRAVRIWDATSGKLVRILRGHADEVWSAAFSPDGSKLATGGKDGSVLLWPMNSAVETKDVAYKGWSRPLFSPDGEMLVLREGGASPRAQIVRSGRPIQRSPEGWAACGVSQDGLRLLLWSAEETPSLRWWDMGRSEFGAAFVGAMDLGGNLLIQTGLSWDGGRVFQLTRDWDLVVWTPEGGSPLRRMALPKSSSALRSMTLSRGARWFAWSFVDGSDIWLADVDSGTIRALRGHRNTVNSVVFSPDGSQLASAGSDGSVRLWDCKSGTAIGVFTGHLESADDVAFSPDGRTLVSLGALQSIKFWSLLTRHELATIAMPEAGSFLALSPDGHHLAVTLGDLESGEDRGARELEAPEEKPLKREPEPGF